jgi:hypothetical protein
VNVATKSEFIFSPISDNKIGLRGLKFYENSYMIRDFIRGAQNFFNGNLPQAKMTHFAVECSIISGSLFNHKNPRPSPTCVPPMLLRAACCVHSIMRAAHSIPLIMRAPCVLLHSNILQTALVATLDTYY